MRLLSVIVGIAVVAMAGSTAAQENATGNHNRGRYAELNDHILAIRRIQVEALQETRDALLRVLPERMTVSRVIKGLNLDSLNVENRNDYRNYVWITVTDGEEEYWITAIYQDQDLETGNMHHQTGRIQFWHNIRHYSKRWCSTPNDPAGDGRHWVFNYDSAYDPRIKIYDPDFSGEKVAAEFVGFLQTICTRH